ncbi:MAG: ABC transporter permease [Alphaproteobacteria bacterium]|nr:MAG: ABC transporter permease [Alphaproteobacteria bacterium]
MPQSRSALTKSRVRSAWLFLIPTLVLLFVVAGWPLARTISFSLTDANLSNLQAAQWVGLENFKLLFEDDDWWISVKNTLFFTFISVFFETILGLMIALVLNTKFKGRGLVRMAVLVPWAIPTIVSARMWGWMFHDVYGVFNYMLQSIGILSKPLAWTADPDLALFTVIIVDVWKTTPFMSLLMLAGLQMLPQECYEAARVDGIHPIRVFFKITLPLLKPAIVVAVIFRTLDAVRVFDLIYVLTSGSQDTMSMSVYARQQLFDFQNIGLGSAASTLLFLMIASFTIVYMSFSGLNKERN